MSDDCNILRQRGICYARCDSLISKFFCCSSKSMIVSCIFFKSVYRSYTPTCYYIIFFFLHMRMYDFLWAYNENYSIIFYQSSWNATQYSNETVPSSVAAVASKKHRRVEVGKLRRLPRLSRPRLVVDAVPRVSRCVARRPADWRGVRSPAQQLPASHVQQGER